MGKRNLHARNIDDDDIHEFGPCQGLDHYIKNTSQNGELSRLKHTNKE
jgi:hypothetical protein